MELKEAKVRAQRIVVKKLRDWHEITSSSEPVIESSRVSDIGGSHVYILHGYVEVEFVSGWRTSAREHSRTGRILFTLKMSAEDGKILSIEHNEKL